MNKKFIIVRLFENAEKKQRILTSKLHENTGKKRGKEKRIDEY